jgi:hypothetical protein
MKRLAILLLLVGCGHSPTGIGDVSPCVKTTAAVRTFTLRGDANTYALEVGLCAYKVDGNASQVADSLVIVVSRDQLIEAAGRVR